MGSRLPVMVQAETTLAMNIKKGKVWSLIMILF